MSHVKYMTYIQLVFAKQNFVKHHFLSWHCHIHRVWLSALMSQYEFCERNVYFPTGLYYTSNLYTYTSITSWMKTYYKTRSPIGIHICMSFLRNSLLKIPLDQDPGAISEDFQKGSPGKQPRLFRLSWHIFVTFVNIIHLFPSPDKRK